MKVFELTFKVYLLKNIQSNIALVKIAELIDNSLSHNDVLIEFHNANKFKNYSFNSLFKIEEDHIYKEGNIYSVKIRTVDDRLAEYFTINLAHEYTDYIKGLTIDCRVLKKKLIEKVYSITPTIIKTEEGYWQGKLTLEEFENRLKENLIKKYNDYFGTKIDENFDLFHRIELNNRKPVASSYKNVKLLGDKLTLYIDENEIAQELAYFSLGTGIGEMNARGYGFMNYKCF
ncbi:CRISPR-associated endoribonuclease Cas6 [Alkaliphilus hydrothermalis]|uniref:CRISPR-associated endoribonuclease Cas6 n=1 Tax=Alkaliphilus hydrothermalis TaxID=1482730 RepID=A0ABS2NNV4_9FIRM|nr:CRISPR-associated endoribonuclease Cas6 [Alkaliphilus hydrothermalis]MBM7614507.1 CRISPR-associated endoribonuclease Cas6 [Alkaliphilus hydrothermalis]